MPTPNQIKEYISDDVTKKVLGRQLGAVDISKLNCDGCLSSLTEFVRSSFRLHFRERDVNGVKKLDPMTKDLLIPSRSAKNIANSLNVSYFI